MPASQSIRLLLTTLALWASPSAVADESNYLNLSFTGDAHTPSAPSLLTASDRTPTPPMHGTSQSQLGDAAYSVAIPTLPALFAPSVALSHTSSGSAHSTVARGWSVAVGPTISRLTGSALNAFADVPGACLLSGGGLDGTSVGSGDDGSLVSAGPSHIAVSYDPQSLQFTLASGGVTTVLEPSNAVDCNLEPNERTCWLPVSQVDGRGNAITHDWDGHRLGQWNQRRPVECARQASPHQHERPAHGPSGALLDPAVSTSLGIDGPPKGGRVMGRLLHIANKNYSSWSLRPWVLMTALGVPFEERMHPFGTEDFTTFSPTALVPCLVDGPHTVWDSLAIAEHLFEDVPEVWPASREARTWARCAAAEMHSGFPALREQCSMNCRIRVRLHRVDDTLARDLARLDALWQEGLQRFGCSYLASDSFTAVDAFFAPVAFRIMTYDLALAPASEAYAARLRAHPAMVAWYQAALAEPWSDDAHDAGITTWGAIVDDLRHT